MAVKRGLGRGLGAMIPTGSDSDSKRSINKKEVEEEPVSSLSSDVQTNQNVSRETSDQASKEENSANSSEILIRVNDIEPNQNQPRKDFNEDSLQELADSIKLHGVIQPLLVSKKGKRYEIIAGERRWRAARLAGLKEIPVIVKDYSDREVMEISLIENIQREDLNAIEEAQALDRLITEYDLTQEEIADRVSKSRSAVTNSLRLLKLDERVQQMLSEGLISSGHARTLLALEDGEVQYQTARQVVEHSFSVRDLEKLVKRLNQPQPAVQEEEPVKQVDDNEQAYKAAEAKLQQLIGSKVAIRNKKGNRGTIEINYYSLEEFERITEMMEKISS